MYLNFVWVKLGSKSFAPRPLSFSHSINRPPRWRLKIEKGVGIHVLFHSEISSRAVANDTANGTQILQRGENQIRDSV